jgi:hypothetical protein
MTIEVDNKGLAVSYLDPECLCSKTLSSTDNTVSFSVSYMLNAFKKYATKNLMLTAYLSMNHWIAVAIVPKQGTVYYLDSLKTINTNTDPFERIINEYVISFLTCPQQTVHSILINNVLTIVACFVVGLGKVTAAKISSCTLAPWNTSKMLRYIPLISFLWKLVLKLEFISSRSPLFFFVRLLQCHQQPTGSRLCGFYCAYHMLQLKDSSTHMEILSWDLHL